MPARNILGSLVVFEFIVHVSLDIDECSKDVWGENDNDDDDDLDSLVDDIVLVSD